MYIIRVVLAIVAGIFVSVLSSTLIMISIPDSYNQEYIQILILGMGLLFILLSFFSTILRGILCILAGSCIVLTGLVVWLPITNFVMSYSNSNVPVLFFTAFSSIIFFLTSMWLGFFYAWESFLAVLLQIIWKF
jgi:hypothetical protein